MPVKPKASATTAKADKPQKPRQVGSARLLAKTPKSTPSAKRIVEEPATTSTRLIVAGMVTLADGSAATSATVWVGRSSSRIDSDQDEIMGQTTTTANGHYRLTVPAETLLFVKARQAKCATVGFQLAETSAALAHTKKEIVNLVLPPSASISGKVVDEDTSAAVSKVLVKYWGKPPLVPKGVYNVGKVMSDAQGCFSFDDVVASSVTLSVFSTAHPKLEYNTQAPTSGVVLRLSSKGASIEGNVFLLSNRSGVSSATVQLWDVKNPAAPQAVQQASTDDLGGFAFKLLPKGSYRLTAQKGSLRSIGDWATSSTTLRLGAKETTSGVRLFLYGGHTIKGQVTQQGTSQPLQGVRVQLNDQARHSAETGADGEFRISEVFAREGSQEVMLSVRKAGYMLVDGARRPSWLELALNPEALEVQRHVEMVKLIDVTGKVHTSAGKPVGSARISPIFVGPGRGVDSVQSKPDGSFSVGIPPFSKLRLKAEAAGYAAGYSDLIEVRDRPTSSVDIVMNAGVPVSGTVYDPNGRPMSGASVFAYYAAGGGGSNVQPLAERQTTGEGGRFAFANLPPCTVRLWAAKSPFVPSAEKRINLATNEEKEGLKLVLRQAHSLSGRVTDDAGKPLAGVTVSASATLSSENSGGSAQSSADGRYVINNLAESPVNVVAALKGYRTERKEAVKAGRNDVDFVLRKSQSVKVTGVVVDYKSGEPIANFDVETLSGPEARKATQLPGRFVIEGLWQGDTYQVWLEAPGYMPVDSGLRTVPDTDKELVVRFELGPGGGIVGRTVAEGTHDPVQGITVDLMRVDQGGEASDVIPTNPLLTSVSGADGSFSLTPSPAGLATVAFHREEPKLTIYRTISIGHGTQTNLGEVEIGSGPGIHGSVVRTPSRSPVGNATVVLDNLLNSRRSQTTTDQSGAFSFSPLPAGHYQLRLPEYGRSQYVSLVEDTGKRVDLTVGSGALHGRVVRAGAPVAAQVTVSRGTESVDSTYRTDSQGAFQAENLSAGNWRVKIVPVEADKVSGLAQEFDAEVVEDGVSEKLFTLTSGRLVGRVITHSGAPGAGARVSVDLLGQSPQRSWFPNQLSVSSAGPDGSFAFDGMTQGVYCVDASLDGQGSAHVEGIQVPDAGDSQQAVLQLEGGGTLESVALNMTTQQPVREAWCYLNTAAGRYNHTQTRDAAGKMVIPNVPPGTYTVCVSSYGFSEDVKQVEIKAGETAQVVSVLYEAGSLRWVLVDANGSPVAGVPCRLTALNTDSIESPRQGVTDANGAVVWRGLQSGRYSASATPATGAPLTVETFIQAHQPSSVVSTLNLTGAGK